MPWIATTSPTERAPAATRVAQRAITVPSPAEKMSACPALSSEIVWTSRTERASISLSSASYSPTCTRGSTRTCS